MTDDTTETAFNANGEDAPLSESSDELIARAKDAFRQQPDSSRFEARTKHPEKIGQYRIVSVLGGGGMGTVYEAEQQSPQRAVALKVVRSERYLDEHAVRLFQREAQTLARLRHPGIAAIYEAGCTADGQHFFAMELVRGEVLNRSTRTKDLDERGRLRVFIKICDAINYAHQRGVIHRDLKPANIVIDTDGRPKVLDFGLARITDADVAAATIVTDVGRIQGTLAYMSPEQARGNPDEIDLRSDVYSLGVILYELMTGRLPYDVGATALHEAVRTVCEEVPIRPSGIDRHLRGDLETIILKALEKDPSRRYQSAAALAEDVERFLSDRSVLASPPSTLYQLRKLAVRHKAATAFTATVFVLVLGFAIWMRVLYGAEQAQRMLADQNLSRAKTAEAQAGKEAETAKEVKDFLVGVFAVSDPDENKGNTIRAREILDRGAARIKEELAHQPAVQGELMHTMGLVYRNLGLYDPATELLEEALEVRRRAFDEPHLDIAESLHHLGWLYRHKGDYRLAEVRVAKALDMRRELLHAQHPDVIDSSLILATVLRYRGDYAEAERLIRQVLASQRETLGDEHEEVARTLETLAELLTEVGDYDEGADAARLAMQMRTRLLGVDHSYVASSKQALAAALRGRGEYSEAEDLLRNAVEIYRKSMGADHQYYAEVLSSLGAVLLDQGDYQAAAPLLEQAVEVCRKRLHPDDPYIARSVGRLGWLLIDQGDYGEAESLLREALAIHRVRTGGAHPNLISPLVGLAQVRLAAGDVAGAEGYVRQALAICREKFPAGHWSTVYAESVLGRCLVTLGRYDEADPLLTASLDAMETQRGITDRYVVEVFNQLIHLYDLWGKTEEEAKYKARLSASHRAVP